MSKDDDDIWWGATPTRVDGRGAQPGCFGNPAKYNNSDRECWECPFNGDCKKVVDKKMYEKWRGGQPGDAPGHQYGQQRMDEPKPVPLSPSESPTADWVAAVALNATLRAAASFVEAVARGIFGIPLFKIPDPLRDLRAKQDRRDGNGGGNGNGNGNGGGGGGGGGAAPPG